MRDVTVKLPADIAAFLDREVAAGSYASASDAVVDSLRRLEREKASEQARLEALREALTVGLADARAGRFAERPLSEILGPTAARDREPRS
jgi:putative addiction module CopG family antidote